MSLRGGPSPTGLLLLLSVWVAGATEVEYSCEGKCNLINKEGNCWCDKLCHKNDDCCEDVETVCRHSSCYGRCGGKSTQDCWCDTNCAKQGDCCDDFVEMCAMSSCDGTCGKQSLDLTCWCDKTCTKQGDCCADYEVMCSSPADMETEPCAKDCACALDSECCGDAWDDICEQVGDSKQCETECAETTPSCAGICDELNAYHKCWCDASCKKKGDCCPDYADHCFAVLNAVKVDNEIPNLTVTAIEPTTAPTTASTLAPTEVTATDCNDDSECPGTHFCAQEEQGKAAQVCQPFVEVGGACAGLAYTPLWGQLRCLPPQICDYAGSQVGTSVGTCASSDVCSPDPCGVGTACTPIAITPGYVCIVDVCEPNPCSSGLLCVPDPKSCAMALACPQYICQTEATEDEPPVVVVEENPYKVIFVSGQLATCATDEHPYKQCLLVKGSSTSDWQIYPYYIQGLKWEYGYEYRITVAEDTFEGTPRYTLMQVNSKAAVPP